MKLYAATYFSMRHIGQSFIPSCIKANNKAEALGIALQVCKELMPENKGYFNHIADVVEISREFIEEAHKSIKEESDG